MSLIIPANSASAAGGYAVDNSLRFNDGSSDYLNRTPSSAGNRRIFTFSFWVKRATLGTSQFIYNVRPSSSGASQMLFASGDKLQFSFEPISKSLETNRVFRDISAWYNIIFAVDTTQGTAANRIKLYVNGVQETSFGTANYPDQNADLDINTTNVINIGRRLENSGSFIDMYLSEFVFIDGQALAPDQFGEFDEDSGIWKPIDVSGLTFGTNGFYLDFKDSGALGADVSGKSNNFTVNNLTAIDQSTDTCTNNFATLNPLNVNPSSAGDAFTEGNLKLATSNNSNSAGSTATMAFTKGKWYAEVKYTSATAWNGVMPTDATINGDTGRMNWYQGRTLYLSGSNTANWGSNVSAGDIVGIALDMDNSRVTISQSGQWWGGSSFNQAQPHTFQALISGYDTWTFLCASGSGTSTSEWNFGSPPFAISSGNQDANGYGNMEFPVPTDYFICNTKNLSEFG